MTSPLPRYRRPPVQEVAIGVQFDPLPAFSTAHAGRYWAQVLGQEWASVVEIPRLEDQFERFGDERQWSRPSVALRGYEPGRLQIVRSDDERVIQVQNTRYVCNWRKRSAEYPSFGTLFPEFRSAFDGFCGFARASSFPSPTPNQWEITYINHLERGELWTTLDDWKTIIPGFFIPRGNGGPLSFDEFSGAWQLVIGDNLGRLHVVLNHGKLSTATLGPEVLSLMFTARGPIDPTRGLDVATGLQLGHKTIVRTFTEITSDAAHKAWDRVE